MNIKIVTFTVLIIFTCSSMAQSQAEDEATAVFEKFLVSLTNLEADTIVELFSDDAMFWGTRSKKLVVDTAGIRQYFSGLSKRLPGKSVATALQCSVLVLSENTVLISGMWSAVTSGHSKDTKYRNSMVLSKRSGQWKIVQFHNSIVPG